MYCSAVDSDTRSLQKTTMGMHTLSYDANVIHNTPITCIHTYTVYSHSEGVFKNSKLKCNLCMDKWAKLVLLSLCVKESRKKIKRSR